MLVRAEMGFLGKILVPAILGIAGLLLSATVNGQASRDYVYVVGSSTVYPFAAVVAERFGHNTRFKTPKIESTGSGGGLKLFCEGVGVDHPDIANASRRIRKSEIAACVRNGVSDIIEIKIGYDGIVIANSVRAEPLKLSSADIFFALAKSIPGSIAGELEPNQNRTWADVREGLPQLRIEVLGPPPTSGTRDIFVEMAMEAGCNTIDWVSALRDTDAAAYRAICHTVREDGAFVEVGENDNLIVQKLDGNPRAFGIFGFNFFDQNMEKVQVVTVDGIAPTFEAIEDGEYPVSRPLYLYVKKAHVNVIPGLRGYLREFTSERAWGDEGYLSDRGLVPMPAPERRAVALAVQDLVTIPLAQQE